MCCVLLSLATSQHQISFVSWTTPIDPWLKFNSDDSVHSSDSAACGGVLRNSEGCFVCAFTANVGHCPVVVAELWGALYALEVAWSMGLNNLILELDSSSTVSLIHHSIDNWYPFSSLISKIKRLLERNWLVRVEHVYHEANHAADSMVSMGHVLTLGLHVFFYPPKELRSVLLDYYRRLPCLI